MKLIEAVPTEYTEEEFDVTEDLIPTINTGVPENCPFRRDEKCIIFIKYELERACSMPFVSPDGCPLGNNLIIVK